MKRWCAPLILLLCLTASPALAAEKQIWECRTEHPGAQPILHLVEWGSRSYIKFAHMRFSARYELDDDQHAWHWSNEGAGYYRYALVLHSDGKAWYHDFSQTGEDGLSEPLDYFLCSEI